MDNILEKFNQKFNQKLNRFCIHDINLNWYFEGLPSIINVNNLYSIVNAIFKSEMNKVEEDDIKNKIICLRNCFIDNFDNNLKLLELYKNSNEHIINNYLTQYYVLLKKFINESLLVYIFHNKIHSDVIYKNTYVDVDDFYNIKKAELHLQVLKIRKIFVRSVVTLSEELSKLVTDLDESINNQKSIIKKLLKKII